MLTTTGGVLASTALMAAAAHGLVVTDGEPSVGRSGAFDLYVFARFFEPDYAKCQTPVGEGHLAMHGVWPQYTEPVVNPDTHEKDQYWPQFCNETNTKYWDNVKTLDAGVKAKWASQWSEWAPDYVTGLADHEWTKHGSCVDAGIYAAEQHGTVADVQDRWVQDMADLVALYPTPAPLLAARKRKEPIRLQTLAAYFAPPHINGTSVVFRCKTDDTTGHLKLNMVSYCLARAKDGSPGSPVVCGDDVIQSDYTNNCGMTSGPNPLIYVDTPCK